MDIKAFPNIVITPGDCLQYMLNLSTYISGDLTWAKLTAQGTVQVKSSQYFNTLILGCPFYVNVFKSLFI